MRNLIPRPSDLVWRLSLQRLTMVFAMLGASLQVSTAAEPNLSYPDLVKRLTDLEHLATLPDAGEQCAQWSSYDRKSKFDPATGKYLDWDANGDNDGILRLENGKQVLGEMKGPGCIWRIWSAAPKDGHVRIYLDDATDPAIDLPFVGYFDQKHAPFNRPALVHTVARGWNNYTPIPFQKSCKIVADPDWGQYYQFVYSTFSPGTGVPTFQMNLAPADAAALDEANRSLIKPGPAPAGKTSARGQLTGTQPTATSKLSGPAAITAIRVKTKLPPNPGDIDTLRSTTIEIRWDGDAQLSVWAPLGDFFGTAPGANVYRSLPLGLTEDGTWYCNWFMPFARNAEITFHKEGQSQLSLDYEIDTKPLPGNISNLGRFHAKWHRDAFLPSQPERAIDWTMLKVQGRGRFVGVNLHIWNPRGSWWGEGDEKFFVDGETMPSTFGTGSEDYFGYAWCDPGLFQNAFHNQTRNDGNNKGHVSVNRWHISDQIPFHKSFEGAIEKYYSNKRPTLYAATVYWYLAPDATEAYAAVPLTERIGYWTPVESFKVKGALEGEKLRILKKTGGNPQEQDLTGFASEQWSGDSHLWWIDAKPSDRLDLAFPVAKTGKYKVTAQFTKAKDYGIVQLSINDTRAGGPMDLYNADVVPSGAQDLGIFDFRAGDQKLTVEILGANEKAVKSYMFGLDYLKLEPQ
jgi:hypothetical protein